MSDYVYTVRLPILAVKVTKIVAGDTVEAIASPGATQTTALGSVAQTLAGCHPTMTQGEEVFDALKVFVKSPTVAGSSPDAILTFKVDNKDMSGYQQIDVNLDRNMAPWPTDVAGGPFDASGAIVGGLELGKSLSKMANDLLDGRLSGRGNPSTVLPINTAIKATGLKGKQSLTIQLTSQDGFDASTTGTPALILVYGEILTKSYVAAMETLYNGQVTLNSIDRSLNNEAQIRTLHTLGGLISVDNFDQLSGGPNQRGVKINRKITCSTNGVATNGNGQEFRYTRNVTPLGGGANNTAAGITTGAKVFGLNNQDYDLGVLAKTNDVAWIIELFGVRWVANLAYVGWIVNTHRIPALDVMDGLPIIGEFTNPYQYGALAGKSNVFVGLPKYPGRLAVYKQNAVPYIRDSGTAVAKASAYIAVAGPYIENVGQ